MQGPARGAGERRECARGAAPVGCASEWRSIGGSVMSWGSSIRALAVFAVAVLGVAVMPAAAAVAAGPTVTCTSDPNIFNTGYNAATGGKLPRGALDPNWRVTDRPARVADNGGVDAARGRHVERRLPWATSRRAHGRQARSTTPSGSRANGARARPVTGTTATSSSWRRSWTRCRSRCSSTSSPTTPSTRCTSTAWRRAPRPSGCPRPRRTRTSTTASIWPTPHTRRSTTTGRPGPTRSSSTSRAARPTKGS